MKPALLNRLYDIFLAEVDRIRPLHLRDNWYDIWFEYMDGLGIMHGHTDDLIEVYNDDPEGFASKVLIRCPAMEVGYLLIPREFADKVLVLGFPDDIVRFAGRR